MCFFFKPAASPQDLVTAVLWWLGHPLKLTMFPALALMVPEVLVRPWIPNMLGSIVLDWANNFNYTFIFLFGYAITAADQSGMKEVLRRGRWLYIGIGLVLGISFSFSWYLDTLIPANLSTLLAMVKLIWKVAAEWTLVLGISSVVRELVTVQPRHLPLLSQMAMPFYLTHQQVLVAILSVSLGVPVLGSFPIILLLATLAVFILSFIITKLNPLRYWFGLTPAKGSFIPGSKLRGFIPTIVLVVLLVIVTCLQIFDL